MVDHLPLQDLLEQRNLVSEFMTPIAGMSLEQIMSVGRFSAAKAFDTNPAVLPPAFVAVCGIDSLRDEGMRFAQKLTFPTFVCYEGEVHRFLTYVARFQAAGNVVDRIAAFLRVAN